MKETIHPHYLMKVKENKRVKVKAINGASQSGRSALTTQGKVIHLVSSRIRNAEPVNRKITLTGGENLTGKESQALEFIRNHVAKIGVMPSRRELQTFLFESGLSTQQGARLVNGVIVSGACSAANVVWQALESKGALARVISSGARGSVLARDEKADELAAVKLLRSLGYSVRKPTKKTIK